MFYKITNKESEIYKTLREFRQKELDIEAENKKAIEEKIPYKWEYFTGYPGQNNFGRVTVYLGFHFTEPEKVDLKVWRKMKDNNTFFEPNRRTKAGREIDTFLRSLKKSSMFKLHDILKFDEARRFQMPQLIIAGDVLGLHIDDCFEPEDENIIEITSKEYKELIVIANHFNTDN